MGVCLVDFEIISKWFIFDVFFVTIIVGFLASSSWFTYSDFFFSIKVFWAFGVSFMSTSGVYPVTLSKPMKFICLSVFLA